MKVSVKVIQFIIAINLMAIGISLSLKANIGIGSWDVLHNNLNEFYNIYIGPWKFTYGTWVFIVGIITILISQLLDFQPRNFIGIITGLVIGKVIDLWYLNIFIFNYSQLEIRIPMFFLGIFSLGSGISLLVLSKLPPTPPDILMISLINRFNLSFLTSKTITEVSVFIVAILIGIYHGIPFNNIGLGTLLTLVLIGSIIQISSRIWKKLFKLV